MHWAVNLKNKFYIKDIFNFYKRLSNETTHFNTIILQTLYEIIANNVSHRYY